MQGHNGRPAQQWKVSLDWTANNLLTFFPPQNELKINKGE